MFCVFLVEHCTIFTFDNKKNHGKDVRPSFFDSQVMFKKDSDLKMLCHRYFTVIFLFN